MPCAAPVITATLFLFAIESLCPPGIPSSTIKIIEPTNICFSNAKQLKLKSLVLYSAKNSELPPCLPFPPSGQTRGSDPTGGFHGDDGINAHGARSVFVDRLGSSHRRLHCLIDLA